MSECLILLFIKHVLIGLNTHTHTHTHNTDFPSSSRISSSISRDNTIDIFLIPGIIQLIFSNSRDNTIYFFIILEIIQLILSNSRDNAIDIV